MKIEVNDSGLFINGKQFEFPFKIEKLVAELGNWSFHERVTYVWDALGLSCTANQGNMVDGIYLRFIAHSAYDPHPAEQYTGEYLINGTPHNALEYFAKQQFGDIEILNTDLQAKDVISHSLIQKIAVY